jgi:DNA-binding SARP family transcriptional activator
MNICLLGHMVVSVNGVRLDLPSAKQRTLLALLALRAPQPVATESIMSELWPELDQTATQGTLRTHIFKIRKAIGDQAGQPQAGRPVLRAVGGGYQLIDVDAQLDTEAFTKMTAAGSKSLHFGDYLTAGARFGEALELWRGRALADVPRGPRLEAVARHLEESRLMVHGHHADVNLRLGLHRELMPKLASLVEHHPLDEGIALRYMIALYRCDRRADALAFFQQLRCQLVDHLGLEPSKRLQEVHNAILNAHPSIELPLFA